jgi:hypothetical protein
MFYGNNVQDTRQLFYSSWQAYRQNRPLSPLEQQLVDVIMAHPEYHAILEAHASPIDQNFFPELGQTNPFLHMGLHLAIRDQVATNRPAGIADIYLKLNKKYSDKLAVEHLMMDSLVECLWKAQRDQTMPDEVAYVHALTMLC